MNGMSCDTRRLISTWSAESLSTADKGETRSVLVKYAYAILYAGQFMSVIGSVLSSPDSS